jgi:hypothetical protein
MKTRIAAALTTILLGQGAAAVPAATCPLPDDKLVAAVDAKVLKLRVPKGAVPVSRRIRYYSLANLNYARGGPIVVGMLLSPEANKRAIKTDITTERRYNFDTKVRLVCGLVYTGGKNCPIIHVEYDIGANPVSNLQCMAYSARVIE